MKSNILILIFILSGLFLFSNEKTDQQNSNIHFFSKILSKSNPSFIKFESENVDKGTASKKNSDYKDIAGFTVYTSFTFLSLISGIPLIAVGCYNYSINLPGEQTLPYIITGAVSIAIGGIMLTLLICAVAIVFAMFKGFKLGSNKQIAIKIII